MVLELGYPLQLPIIQLPQNVVVQPRNSIYCWSDIFLSSQSSSISSLKPVPLHSKLELPPSYLSLTKGVRYYYPTLKIVWVMGGQCQCVCSVKYHVSSLRKTTKFFLTLISRFYNLILFKLGSLFWWLYLAIFSCTLSTYKPSSTWFWYSQQHTTILVNIYILL